MKLQKEFLEEFPQYQTVREYYIPRKDDVVIEDVSKFVPELLRVVTEVEEELA